MTNKQKIDLLKWEYEILFNAQFELVKNGRSVDWTIQERMKLVISRLDKILNETYLDSEPSESKPVYEEETF